MISLFSTLLAQTQIAIPTQPTQAVDAPLVPKTIAYHFLAPELVLIGAALLLLFGISMTRKRPPSEFIAVFTTGAGLISLLFDWILWGEVNSGRDAFTTVSGAVILDGFSIFMVGLISIAVVLGGLIAAAYMDSEHLDGAEYAVLMLLSAAGGMFMVVANDLIMTFAGLEILSIALYVMAGFHRFRKSSGEASLKYFVLGGFSSAIFLYGIALTYGATGSTNLGEISAFLQTNVVLHNGVLLAGMALMLVGLCFKVAAVPFHMWTPDVYQGAPSPATGFMGAAAKVAGFAALLRILFSTLGSLQLDWQPIIWFVAVASIVVGSIMAVVQSDIKRMLAYSSISHAGYVLIGLQAGSKNGIAGAMFYLLAYTFMVLGSFGVITIVGGHGDGKHSLSDYRGLSKRSPMLAFAFTILLLSQAGVPLTSGFIAKFGVISAAIQAHSYALAIQCERSQHDETQVGDRRIRNQPF